MATGKMKWFKDDKGYGFIIPDDGSREVFVHHSVIVGQNGRKTLMTGDVVEYEAEHCEKGLQAVTCRRISEVMGNGNR